MPAPRVLIFLLIALTTAGSEFRVAKPGYEYEFPRDHFDHPEFQTEWWYYTGNLRTENGRRFGFELTFFRHGVGRDEATDGVWALDDLYLGHLALSDIEGGEFHHTERVNRAGPGVAGISAEDGILWNGNWSVRWEGERQMLEAVTDKFALRLELIPRKPPVIHGVDGVSRKAEGAGRASHYISLTRIDASGGIELNSDLYHVAGTAWMDHEFFTNQLADHQVGWDWMSIQLEDQSELMVGQLRLADGSRDPFSSGTFVYPDGRTRHLAAEDFIMEPGRKWGPYPVEWTVRVPSLDIELEATPMLDEQELTGGSRYSPTYWEGAMKFRGTHAGVGYLEMTGYRKPVNLPQQPVP